VFLMVYPLEDAVVRDAARTVARQVVNGRMSMEDLRLVLTMLGIAAEQLRT
jgi:hypothetical protein